MSSIQTQVMLEELLRRVSALESQVAELSAQNAVLATRLAVKSPPPPRQQVGSSRG